jgi:type III secretion protein J
MTFTIQSLFLSARRLCLAGVIMLLTACGAQVELLSAISESEANEALAALLDADIKAAKTPGKEGLVNLQVEQSQVAKAITILQAEGLPRERYAKMGEVFRKEGLISSPLEERARYLWALSQELSATVSQIDGVMKARVHVVLPERSTGGDPALPSSAAVFIKYKQGYNLDDAIPSIKRLVANSISGLTADKVSVVLLPASVKSSVNARTDRAPLVAAGADQQVPLSDTTIWSMLGIFTLLLLCVAYVIWRKWGSAGDILSGLRKGSNNTAGSD